MTEHLKLHDCEPAAADILGDVVRGLTSPEKYLPAKLFYDERGSQLFDRICETVEYYPMRAETAIMKDNVESMAQIIGPGVTLIEFGSGSSIKTRFLLDHLEKLAAYVPIDISREHLLQSAEKIARDYSDLEVLPVCADYEQPFTLPVPRRSSTRRVVYFPGSTIGNFLPRGAIDFMRRTAHISTAHGTEGALLIGVDLKKDTRILEAAYNDSAGVTAAFNLNILLRVNRDAGADFDVDLYRHVAFYNEEEGRIEMHLESTADHTVSVGGHNIEMVTGERIWTEASYKYSEEEFAVMAQEAGYSVSSVWLDDLRLFSVQLLTTRDSGH